MAQLQESPVVMDWTSCPLVEVNPGKLGGTPILRGSRMPADAIVENYMSGLSADEIAAVFQLPTDGVLELLTYAAQRLSSLQA